MPIISSGQITITDFNDAVSLTTFISTNKAKTQIYNPDNGTYIPDWSVSPYMVLTPSLFVAGTSGDIITSTNVQSITWYDAAAPTTALTEGTTYGIPTSGLKTLTIKTNVLSSIASKDYVATIVYRDPNTGLDLTTNATISLSKVINGGGIADAIVTTPNGNIFKNGNAATLTAVANLYRGSTIDTSSVTYQWYRQDSAVTTDQGGGIGWRKLDATTNFGTTGYTTNTLTIPTGAVLNAVSFKCIITDTDTASNTYNQKFFDVASFTDQTDPYAVVVDSTGGNFFKNGIGSSTLTARLFQSGNELDAGGTAYVYKWYKYDNSGNLVANFGGTTSYKTGKTLAVGDADVATKATFKVEVEK